MDFDLSDGWDQTSLLRIIRNLHMFSTKEWEGIVRFALCLFVIFLPVQLRFENPW